MAVILASPTRHARGILVLTHKEMACISTGQLRSASAAEREEWRETMERMQRTMHMGVHFGWRITRRQTWPNQVTLAFAPTGILPNRFKPRRILRVPYSSAHFIPDDFARQRQQLEWDLVSVSTNATYKRLDTLVKCWSGLASDSQTFSGILISKRDGRMPMREREEWLEKEFPSRPHREGQGEIRLDRAVNGNTTKGHPIGVISDTLLASRAAVLYSHGEGHSKFLSEALMAGARPVVYRSMAYAGGRNLMERVGVRFMSPGLENKVTKEAIVSGPLRPAERQLAIETYGATFNLPKMQEQIEKELRASFNWMQIPNLHLALPSHDLESAPWMVGVPNRETTDIQTLDELKRLAEWTSSE